MYINKVNVNNNGIAQLSYKIKYFQLLLLVFIYFIFSIILSLWLFSDQNRIFTTIFIFSIILVPILDEYKSKITIILDIKNGDIEIRKFYKKWRGNVRKVKKFELVIREIEPNNQEISYLIIDTGNIVIQAAIDSKFSEILSECVDEMLQFRFITI